jgi:DNA processing protein
MSNPNRSSAGAPAPVTRSAAALSVLLESRSRRAVRADCKADGGPYAALAQASSKDKAKDEDKTASAEAAIEARLALVRRHRVGLVGFEDDDFPALLSTIPDAPLALYWRGSLTALERPGVAIVGARRASRYGRDLARGLAREVSKRGATVVSGLALGIDGAAHLGALDAGGPTIAVLGSGLNRIQPRTHLPLARRILEHGGLIVSEYPLDQPGWPAQFPERNRLISGLSAGVVVVEASEKSGSLITANFATEQGRDVMAVPGVPGVPNSAGVNRLLKTGAALVETADDVLDALGLHAAGDTFGALAVAPRLSAELGALLEVLDAGAMSVDTLAAELGLGVRDVVMRLTELEIGGFVERVADGYIRRPLRL